MPQYLRHSGVTLSRSWCSAQRDVVVGARVCRCAGSPDTVRRDCTLRSQVAFFPDSVYTLTPENRNNR